MRRAHSGLIASTRILGSIRIRRQDAEAYLAKNSTAPLASAPWGGARMTSLQIADLLHARPVGTSRWMARCPKHQDRSPSLSIREGQSGRILIRCFAGCTTGDILNKLGLSWADICGEPMTREKIRQSAAERQERELHQKRRRAVERSAFDRLRQLHCISDELGSRLANDPDGPGADDVARLFHETLSKIRQVEVVSR